jgi:gliding motility-associated-like protein
LKKIITILSYLFISISLSQAQNPIASFTSLPLKVNDTITICANQTITFINTSTATIVGTTYSWNFGVGANPLSSNLTGPITVKYTTPSNSIIASLVVNNNNGSLISIYNMVVVVKQSPNSILTLTSSGNGFSTTTQNGNTVFKKCNAADTTLFNFQTNYNNSFLQNYTWGDGTIANQDSLIGNQIKHRYAIGQNLLTHNVTLANGCSQSKDYIVFNGNAPIVTVSGSSQNTCLPLPYSFQLVSNKVPISYQVSFSDGSAANNFTTVSDTTVSHVFNTSSCGVDYQIAPSLPPIKNAFSATIIAQNFCSVNGIPTVLTIGPISISTKSKSAFNYAPISPICQNETVNFINETNKGITISSLGCDSNYSFYWKVVQTSGYSIVNGNTGSTNGYIANNYDYTKWTNGSSILSLKFDTPATYQVWLFTANSCGIDSTMKEIIIKPLASVNISMANQTICSGDSSTGFTLTSTVAGYRIIWEVIDTLNIDKVPIQKGEGISPLVFKPIRLFNNSTQPGYFKINATVGCTNVTKTFHTINVNPISQIIASPMQSFLCSGEATNINLLSSLSTGNFSWTVSAPSSITGAIAGNGNKISQTLVNNGNKMDTVKYTISMSGVNCPGSKIDVFVIVQPPLTIKNLLNVSVCSGSFIKPDTFATIPSGANFNWVNSNPAIGISNTGNGNINPWYAPLNNGSIPIIGEITITAKLNSCPVTTTKFTVTINPNPKFQATLSPSSGLDCISNQGEIIGSTIPSNCKVFWNGPLILSGDSTLTPKVGLAGIYKVNITDNLTGCIANDSVRVSPPTPIKITSINKKDVTCFNGSDGSILVTTDNAPMGLNYTWNPSVSINNQAKNLKVGTYQVVVNNIDGCKDTSKVIITQPDVISVNLLDTISGECGEENGSIFINASGGKSGFSYYWNNGKIGDHIYQLNAGTYIVNVKDQVGCSVNDTFVLNCKPLVPIIVPQFISPNNDGKNDQWIIEHLELYPNNKVQVFNRWGNLVFSASPYNNDWNGHQEGNNEILPAATYFYLIETNKKSQEPYKGFLEIQP